MSRDILSVARDAPRDKVKITAREVRLARVKPGTELQTLRLVFTWDVLLKLLSISAGVLLMTMVEVSYLLKFQGASGGLSGGFRGVVHGMPYGVLLLYECLSLK